MKTKAQSGKNQAAPQPVAQVEILEIVDFLDESVSALRGLLDLIDGANLQHVKSGDLITLASPILANLQYVQQQLHHLEPVAFAHQKETMQ